jgi:hypothetical protein
MCSYEDVFDDTLQVPSTIALVEKVLTAAPVLVDDDIGLAVLDAVAETRRRSQRK